ncbi:MAG: ATP-binding cassette domain-containing protein [Exilibacterium sp.]
MNEIVYVADYREGRGKSLPQAQPVFEPSPFSEHNDDIEMSIRSAIPGRIRWQIPCLNNRPDLAPNVEETICSHALIESATVNPLTGRVLVLFNPSFVLADMRDWLAGAIQAAIAVCESNGGEADAWPRERLEDTAAIGIGAVAFGALTLVSGGGVVLASGLIGAGTLMTGACMQQSRASQPVTECGESDSGVFDKLKPYLTGFKGRLILAGGLGVVGVIFGLARFLFIGLAIDKVLRLPVAVRAAGSLSGLLTPVLMYGLLSMLMTAVQGWFMYKGQSMTIGVAQDIQHALRQRAYQHIQQVPMHYFSDHDRLHIAHILSEDINQIEHIFFACWEVIQLGTAVLALALMFALLLSPLWAFAIVLSIPLLMLGSLSLNKKADPIFKSINTHNSLLRGLLVESLDGIDTIKSYTAEQEQLQRLQRHSLSFLKEKERATALTSAYRPIFEVIVMGATVMTLMASSAAVLEGMSVGVFFLLIMAVRQLFWPLTQFGRVFEMGQGGWNSCSRVFELMEAPIENKDAGKALAKEQARGEILIRNINFGYRPDTPVLKNISLTFKRGKTTAIVGPTGCGKSTLIKLLLRLYDADGGDIFLDGESFSELRISDVRESVAFVSQDSFFFNGSVVENIALGSGDASGEAVERAVDIACARDFVQHLPGKLDENIGERGLKLSGGQRQRLSIARAILKDSPVLVLDEATSSVDNSTQARIQQQLIENQMGKTLIVIAHRLSTVVNADNIYVLKAGEVVQEGNHQALLQQEGLYRHLWYSQV